jgi:glycosyltransferase involved in cell wall biosynthesis
MDVVVVLRPVRPEDVQRRFRGLRVADFDDLLFAAPEDSPAYRGGGRSRDDARERTQLARKALRTFDRVLVSTPVLAEAVADAHARAEVIVAENDLDPRWIAQGRALYREWRAGDPRVIRYLPGSTHRDRDFAVAAPALVGFLSRHPDVLLEVHGQIDLERWRFPAGRARLLRPLVFDHLAGAYASAWATIAPLELTTFGRCKSSIKFTEAAAFGAPCIATPSPAMRAHAGEGLLIADSEEEWSHRLESLLDDDERLSLGRRLRLLAEARASEGKGTRAMVEALRRWSAAI